LFAVLFAPDELEFTGGAVSLMEAPTGMNLSESGTLVYVPAMTDTGGTAATPKHTLVRVDWNGREEPLGADPHEYGFCEISPDGTKVALDVVIDGNDDIRIWDSVPKTLTRLTFDEAIDGAPLWTSDGQRIVF
jgi:Tol biopolymer transport system component